MAEKMLDVTQFARKSYYSERRIRQLCIDGKIPGARKLTSGSRKWLIPESALQKLPEGTGQALQKENIVDGQKAKILEVQPSDLEVRIQRILSLKRAYKWDMPDCSEFGIEHPMSSDSYIELPAQQGNFHVYMIEPKKSRHPYEITLSGPVADFQELWYIAKYEGDITLETTISDISVLMHRCLALDLKVTFIITTVKDLVSERDNIYNQFEKLKSIIDEKQDEEFFSSVFDLEIWDCQGLLEKEKQLGLRLNL